MGTFAADGTSAAINLQKSAVLFLGSAGGNDFGGGTITVQVQGPDGLWYSSADTYTAGDVDNITFSSPSRVRLALASSTAPDLDYAIVQFPG